VSVVEEDGGEEDEDEYDGCGGANDDYGGTVCG
jgi:hypothetical protein